MVFESLIDLVQEHPVASLGLVGASTYVFDKLCTQVESGKKLKIGVRLKSVWRNYTEQQFPKQYTVGDLRFTGWEIAKASHSGTLSDHFPDSIFETINQKIGQKVYKTTNGKFIYVLYVSNMSFSREKYETAKNEKKLKKLHETWALDGRSETNREKIGKQLSKRIKAFRKKEVQPVYLD